MGPVVQAVELDLFTDAAGSVGYAAYFNDRWCADRWPEELLGSDLIRNLMFLELFPIDHSASCGALGVGFQEAVGSFSLRQSGGDTCH